MSETVKDILIVDDEEQMRLALRKMLEREGYSVREAENGDKAIRIHREKQADLIITDIIMPEKEGHKGMIVNTHMRYYPVLLCSHQSKLPDFHHRLQTTLLLRLIIIPRQTT